MSMINNNIPLELNNNAEYMHQIYKTWAKFFANRGCYGEADHYFSEAMKIQSKNPWMPYLLSQVKRKLGEHESALANAKAAANMMPDRLGHQLEVADGKYEVNMLEKAEIKLHNDRRKFAYTKKDQLLKGRIDVIAANMNDCLGDSLAPFLSVHSKIIEKVMLELRKSRIVENRPQWKILRALNKCDVLSLIEKEEVLVSPLEMARRERNFTVYNQIYLQYSYLDVLLLKSLRSDKNLFLWYSQGSTPALKKLLTKEYRIIIKFLKMLQTRSPLYNEKYLKCLNQQICDQLQASSILRIQYQTRRNMITILRSVHHLRKEGNYKRLVKYVEDVMGNYVGLKSYRVMPWKHEFIYEVYYIVALTLSDKYRKSMIECDGPPRNRLITMLSANDEHENQRRVSFIFGDRLTYQGAEVLDDSVKKYKKFLIRMDKRLRFAKLGIEKCYIYHEIGRVLLENDKIDDCYQAACKLVAEAQQCNSRLWEFHGAMLKAKVHASFFKRDRVQKTLDEAQCIAECLRDPPLIGFVEYCKYVNSIEIMAKKKIQSLDSIRKKTRFSSMAKLYTYSD